MVGGPENLEEIYYLLVFCLGLRCLEITLNYRELYQRCPLHSSWNDVIIQKR